MSISVDGPGLELACERFVDWLEKQIIEAGRGDRQSRMDKQPSGRFWLGRLLPEDAIASDFEDREDRLEPCAIGLRLRPRNDAPWNFTATARFHVWHKVEDGQWAKSVQVVAQVSCKVVSGDAIQEFGREQITGVIAQDTGLHGLSASIRIEVGIDRDGRTELAVLLVNTSPEKLPDIGDTRLYETSLTISAIETVPFVLEALPDSFRYDRLVEAYGINCGARRLANGSLTTTDAPATSRMRPAFWPPDLPLPDLRFASLAIDPQVSAGMTIAALKGWGDRHWSPERLDARAVKESWAPAMRVHAAEAAKAFWTEYERLAIGQQSLRDNAELLRAFRLMNDAMVLCARPRYEAWRPFQLGFLLANLSAIVDPSGDSRIADIVWFATGGGKTETYLGLLMTAAFFDRLRGKSTGITAWSRFPLRMLSLQQTQRFANALAAAEIVRRKEGIAGEPFSLGFFVGQGATPNSFKEDPKPNDQWQYDDPDMPERLRILEVCPFCRSRSISVAFNRRLWTLEHRCTAPDCPWPSDRALPFYGVDDEIYRFLPTVVVGTLDKAAGISMQGSMRGLVGPPRGYCPKPGHGHTYMPRSQRKHGCLVPGCQQPPGPLPCEPALYGPSFRLQDELHLLRDSLGAVDSHYEALYDDLQRELCGSTPKILASSATLTGFEKQVDVLYRRDARAFPQPGPSPDTNFWSTPTTILMRRYLAIAPRGLTIDFTVDRLMTVLQQAIRRLRSDPTDVCAEAGVDPVFADALIDLYGTNVIYGTTLRDLDAVMRSMETQVQVEGRLQTASLTGRTEFPEVRKILERLENPEPDFEDRLHLISASSMMSHGVDIDRLNTMIIMGHPLGTAEFIQATARVGRRWPGLVIVVHKIGRERDAGIFRSFEKYVDQGDRFVEPIPVTRRSRRVLDRTIAGLELARILVLHEFKSPGSLATLSRFREFLRTHSNLIDSDLPTLIASLAPDETMDSGLREDLKAWFQAFRRLLKTPPANAQWLSDASPSGAPMRSLRDVEEPVPVFGSEI